MDLVGVSFTSFDDLSDVLVIDILSRLPVKTVVQSTCVSKLWYSLIKNPTFISSYVSHVSDSYIFIVQPQSPSVTVVSDNHVLNRHPNFEIPFETRSRTYEVIGSCNGLVCLTDYNCEHYGHDIYLINPFIHKYKKIDAESSCYTDLINGIVPSYSGSTKVCFGYCEAEKDYKIFRIFIELGYGDVVLKRFEIYSLSTGTWTVMEGIDGLEFYFNSPIFVNGSLYWPPYGYDPDSKLQCFDLKDKLFYNISLPTTTTTTTTPMGKYMGGPFSIDGSVVISLHDYPTRSTHLYYLEKGIGGQWKELLIQFGFHYSCMGYSSATGRLIFADYTDNIVYALDLHNSNVEKLTLNDTICPRSSAAINVVESLVLFSDRC